MGAARAGVFPAMFAAVTVLAVSCTGAESTSSPAPAPTFSVFTTNNIVADWVRQVGGDRVDVSSLLPPGTDPHSFQPGTRDVVRVADANLVFIVSLTLEAAWLDELVRNAAADPSRLVTLGEIADPLELEGGALDPHFWFDPLRVKRAVEEIAQRVSQMDPPGSSVYQANAQAYHQELDALHTWVQEQIVEISPQRRVLVTSHDSLGYFAARYGFEVVGTVIPGLTTEREPSAAELSELVDEIRRLQVPAVFTETTIGDRLARRIADEADIQVVRSIYTDSLGAPGSGAETYVDMIRWDVNEIVEALR